MIRILEIQKFLAAFSIQPKHSVKTHGTEIPEKEQTQMEREYFLVNFRTVYFLEHLVEVKALFVFVHVR